MSSRSIIRWTPWALLVAFIVTVAPISPVLAECCVAPDNGNGTATLPPPVGAGGCVYYGTAEIADGLPPGATIQISATLGGFANVTEAPGGILGGTASSWDATFSMTMTGTGALFGFNRFIQMPMVAGNDIISWGPRAAFAPLQSTGANLDQMYSQIVNDPDFDFLRVWAGDNYNMPSPGAVQLVSTAGSWAVSGYFDLTIRVDFIGAQTSVLAGRSGSTARIRRYSMCPENAVATRPSTWSSMKALYRD